MQISSAIVGREAGEARAVLEQGIQLGDRDQLGARLSPDFCKRREDEFNIILFDDPSDIIHSSGSFFHTSVSFLCTRK